MENLRKLTTFKEDVGKLLLDFGKLIFGGIVLGSIIRGGYSHEVLLVGGLISVALACALGLLFVKKDIDIAKIENNMGERK
jgi:uncharacterized membrane protein YraQ (UPF0718 family)